MATVLEARGLVKDYSRARAVDGVDLVVHEGERVGLLGPNGAGKTTTLLMVLGVVSPDEGSVVVCGRPLDRQRSRAAEHVGFPAVIKPVWGAGIGGAMGLSPPGPLIDSFPDALVKEKPNVAQSQDQEVRQGRIARRDQRERRRGQMAPRQRSCPPSQ